MRQLPFAAAVAALIVAAPAAGRLPQPRPLRGIPLRAPTHLRLVVADSRPFVLDVDSGKVTPLSGVPAQRRPIVAVAGVGGRAAVVSVHDELYGVRGRGADVTPLGPGKAWAPAGDGTGVWIRSDLDASHCTLRELGVDGTEIHAPVAFACDSSFAPAGTLGVVVNRTHVVEPVTGRTVIDTQWGVLAVAGERLVLAGPDKQFELIDASGRVLLTFRWPSILYGLDAPAVDPRGRYVALGFADPAWLNDGRQAMDVWLLDTATLRLTHVPGTFAFVALKFTSMSWTDDGRLVFLAERDDNGQTVVAVWRPGQKRLALKIVRLPQRTGGSDTFAPVR